MYAGMYGIEQIYKTLNARGNRRNGLKSQQQSKKDTNNTSGKSQFLYLIICSDNGETNSHTKSYKFARCHTLFLYNHGTGHYLSPGGDRRILT